MAGAFACESPHFHTLKLFRIRDYYIPFARALVAHTVRAERKIDISLHYQHSNEGLGSDVWRVFDLVLFALRCRPKCLVHVALSGNTSSVAALFPLMSLVVRDE